MFEVQIARGVEYLDQDLGPSWPERVDLDELDLVDCFYCVMGQLYGNFDDTPDTLDAISLGFDLVGGDRSDYGVLTQEWKDKIVQLRAKRGEKP